MEESHTIIIKKELPNDEIDITDIMVEAVDEMCPVSGSDIIHKHDDIVKLEPEPAEANEIHSGFEISFGPSKSYNRNENDFLEEAIGSTPFKGKIDFSKFIKQEYPHEAAKILVKDLYLDTSLGDLNDSPQSPPAMDDSSLENCNNDRPILDDKVTSNDNKHAEIKREPNTLDEHYVNEDDISDFSSKGEDDDFDPQYIYTEPCTSRAKPTNKKRHTCKTCKKGFTAPSLLKIHEVLHSNERKHKCDECDKCFKQACNLTFGK